ncbi:MAG TPA: 23S rRNA (pseudouridine(1915)-N(3))-methyltransferase RlmH [Clostridiales bacterium]|nr:23S rRNA (pseudouridine(1915)-N(3))-methyltransferase RlmH [Clostridiales bacterium]
MKITMLCVGSLKEAYWRDAVAEYAKRMSRFCTLEILETPEKKLPANAGAAEEQAVVEEESRRLAEKIPASPQAQVIALDICGKELSSTELAGRMSEWTLQGKSELVFLIGGSLGMSRSLLDRADFRLSFSPMTFPHQLMRVLLLEQVYRAFKINHNQPYHK